MKERPEVYWEYTRGPKDYKWHISKNSRKDEKENKLVALIQSHNKR